MRHFSKLALIVLVSVIIHASIFSAAAQEYMIKSDMFNQSRLISQSKFTIKVANKPNAPRNEITIHLSSDYPVEGCTKIQPFYAEYEILANTIRVNMSFPVVEPDLSVRYPHYQCKFSGNDLSTDLTFNLDTMSENAVSRIIFVTEEQTYPYTLYFDDAVFRMTPLGNGAQEAVNYNRLPEGTVVLSIPSASEDIAPGNSDLLQQLDTLAKSKNLKPIAEVNSEFMPNNIQKNRFLYVDTQDAFKSKIADSHESFLLGTLNSSEPFYGPNGKFDKPKMLDVFIQHPGADD
jgi:hypothetical protein